MAFAEGGATGVNVDAAVGVVTNQGMLSFHRSVRR